MNADRAIRPFRILAALGLVLAAAFSGAQTVDNKPAVKQEILDNVTEIISHSAYVPGVDFSQWAQFLKDEKPEIDAAKDDDEFRTAVNAALHKLGTSHIVLMTPRAAQARRSGATVGVGISVQVEPEGLAIVRVVKDGAAFKAGIVVGDVITEVDGKDASTGPNMTGVEGSELSIKVKHADGKFDDYKLVRHKYSTLRPPELTWIDHDTAQLKLNTFDRGYDGSKVASLLREAQKAKNLILDLRFNPGGAVVNLQQLLGMLIPEEKPVGTFIKRSTVNGFIESTGGDPSDLAAVADWSERKFHPVRHGDLPMFTGKIVVLVNKFSGSAAEIAAAALHDVLGAPVIGTKSAGAVLASVIDPVSNGFALQYPIEDYITIKGVRLEGNGVTPDIDAQDLNLRTSTPQDDGVEKAMAYFAQAK